MLITYYNQLTIQLNYIQFCIGKQLIRHTKMKTKKSKNNLREKRPDAEIFRSSLNNSKNIKNLKNNKQTTKINTDRNKESNKDKQDNSKSVRDQIPVNKNKKEQQSFGEVVRKFKRLFDQKISFVQQSTEPTTDRIRKEKQKNINANANGYYSGNKKAQLPQSKKTSANGTMISSKNLKNKGFSQLITVIESKLNKKLRQKKEKTGQSKSQVKLARKIRQKSDSKPNHKKQSCKSRQYSLSKSKVHKNTGSSLSLTNLHKNKISTYVNMQPNIYQESRQKSTRIIRKRQKSKKSRTYEHFSSSDDENQSSKRFQKLKIFKFDISQQGDSDSAQVSDQSVIIHDFIDNSDEFCSLKKSNKLENFREPCEEQQLNVSQKLKKIQVENKKYSTIQEEKDIIQHARRIQSRREVQIEQNLFKKQLKVGKNQNENNNQLKSDRNQQFSEETERIEISEMFRTEEQKWLELKKNLEKLKKQSTLNEEDLERIIQSAEANHLALKAMQFKQYSANRSSKKDPKQFRIQDKYNNNLKKQEQSHEKIENNVKDNINLSQSKQFSEYKQNNQLSESNNSININISINGAAINIKSPNNNLLAKQIQQIRRSSISDEIQSENQHQKINSSATKSENNDKKAKIDFKIIEEQKKNDGIENKSKPKKTKLNFQQAPLQIRKILKPKPKQIQQARDSYKFENQKKLLEDISLLQFISGQNSKDSISSLHESSHSTKKQRIFEQMQRHRDEFNSDEKSQQDLFKNSINKKNRIKPKLKISLFSEESPDRNHTQSNNSIFSYAAIDNLVAQEGSKSLSFRLNNIKGKYYDINQKPEKDIENSDKLLSRNNQKQLTFKKNTKNNHFDDLPKEDEFNIKKQHQISTKNIKQSQYEEDNLEIIDNVNIQAQAHQIIFSEGNSFKIQKDNINNMQILQQNETILITNSYQLQQQSSELSIIPKKQQTLEQQKIFKYSQKTTEKLSLVQRNQGNQTPFNLFESEFKYCQYNGQKQAIGSDQKQQAKDIKSRQIYEELLPWLDDKQLKNQHYTSPTNFASPLNLLEQEHRKQETSELHQYQENDNDCLALSGKGFTLSKPVFQGNLLDRTDQEIFEEIIQGLALQLYQIDKRYIKKILKNFCGLGNNYGAELDNFIQKNQIWQENNIDVVTYKPSIRKDIAYIKQFGVAFLQFCTSQFKEDFLKKVSKPLGVQSYELLRMLRPLGYEEDNDYISSNFFPFQYSQSEIYGEDDIGHEQIISLEQVSSFQEYNYSKQQISILDGHQQFFNQALFDYIVQILDEKRPYGKRGLPPLNFYQVSDHNFTQLVQHSDLKIKKIIEEVGSKLSQVDNIKLGVIEYDPIRENEMRRSLSKFLESIAIQIEQDWMSQREGEFQLKYDLVNEVQIMILWGQISQIWKIYHKA